MMEEMLLHPGEILGCVMGLLITAVTAGMGLLMASRLAQSCTGAWRVYGRLFALMMVVCGLTFVFSASRPSLPALQFHGHPNSHARGWSDIGIRSLVVFSSPGICALLAAVAAAFCARRLVLAPPAKEETAVQPVTAPTTTHGTVV